jgi:hypothetical protein
MEADMNQITIDTAGWIRGVGEAETVEVRMSYDPSDPLAVSLRITGETRDDCWVFARDLLADGLRSMVPVGSGAIQVQATSVLTEVSHLTEDGGIEMLRLPWWNTREFIRLTHTAVPRGHEDVDIDSWLDDLTAS